MIFLKSTKSLLEIELISGKIPEVFREISSLGFSIYDVRMEDEITCRFGISDREYRMLQPLLERKGDQARICGISARHKVFQSVMGHPIIILTFLLFWWLTLYLPTRVLFVCTEGNRRVSETQILEAAENYGVCFGASCREINSENVKNGILSDIADLQWVGVTTTGCRATVSVREREIRETESAVHSITRIVADRDGYILSGTVHQGNGLFWVGQTVSSGQTLISGYMDCGYCIRGVRAKGEIYAQTDRALTAVKDDHYTVRTEQAALKRKISLCIRKKRINLWKDSGIYDATCGRMYEEYRLTLPGGFELPVSVCVETFSRWETAEAALSDGTKEWITDFAHQQLKQQMIAGSILDAEEAITSEQNVWILRGSYICKEMIGREQPEQIGDTNGKDDRKDR